MPTTTTADKSALAERIQDASVAASAGRSGPTLLSLLSSSRMRDQLAQALPRQVDPDRFVRVVATELRRTPRLLECTPGSFLAALLEAAALGLEPGPLGHSYLVPYANRKRGVVECQLILGYKGLIDLARRSTEIQSIVSREVREGDYFEFDYGLDEHLVHRPRMDGVDADPVAYWGVAHYRGGGHLIMVLSKADVDRYRARSRARNEGPWVTDYTAMACKTVIRRMAPFLPLTVQALEAVDSDERRELGLDDLVAAALPTEAAKILEPTQDAAPAPLLPVEESGTHFTDEEMASWPIDLASEDDLATD